MTSFSWPGGRKAAFSLSFDDARESQLDTGMPILNRWGVPATFYVLPGAVAQRAAEWREVVAGGHEIGNHTTTHPCSGRNDWSKHNAIEDYDLERMRDEISTADRELREMLGVETTTFAYPCGEKFVGQDGERVSYVPMIAERFLAARGGREPFNDPLSCSLPELNAQSADRATLESLLPKLEEVLENGGWLILLAHEVGPDGIAPDVLDGLCAYLKEKEAEIWTDTIAQVASFLQSVRA